MVDVVVRHAVIESRVHWIEHELASLVRAALEHISISRCNYVTDRGFAELLMSPLPNLKRIVVRRCPGVSEEGLRAVASAKVRAVAFAMVTTVAPSRCQTGVCFRVSFRSGNRQSMIDGVPAWFVRVVGASVSLGARLMSELPRCCLQAAQDGCQLEVPSMPTQVQRARGGGPHGSLQAWLQQVRYLHTLARCPLLHPSFWPRMLQASTVRVDPPMITQSNGWTV